MNEKLFITRKRKKYKFAKFDEFDNCFQLGDWVAVAEVFNNNHKNLVLEIGAGTALFSVELARRHPENFYIAVDIKSDRLYTGAKLANELQIKNIIFVRSGIKEFVGSLPENAVDEVWITFPDPHANEDQTRLTSTGDRKRLTSPIFLDLYKPILKNNGLLHFKTDNKPLFDWSVVKIQSAKWNIIRKTNNLHSSDFGDDYKVMTTYERRFIREDLPILCLSATMNK